jgi:hypothetical protein
MEYTWANQSEGTIKRTRSTEQVETFSLEDLKAERAGILARRAALDKEWLAFQEKIAAIEIALGVKAKDLPSVTGNLVGAK